MNLYSQQALGVLIVEDEKIVRAHLKMLLNDMQIQDVTEAESGKAALDILFDMNRPFPDLIIIDMLMAEMEGIEFCNKVRRSEKLRNAGVPILMLAAAEDRFLQGISMQVGALHVMSKPITSKKLGHMVDRIVRRVPADAF